VESSRIVAHIDMVISIQQKTNTTEDFQLHSGMIVQVSITDDSVHWFIIDYQKVACETILIK
jgi:hypothetical protein